MKRKHVAILLSLVLLLSLVPTGAFAAHADNPSTLTKFEVKGTTSDGKSFTKGLSFENSPSHITEYTLAVPCDANDAITIAIAAKIFGHSSNANDYTIQVDGTEVRSGTSISTSLKSGKADTVIKVVTTNIANGKQNTYTITIHRVDATVTYDPSGGTFKDSTGVDPVTGIKTIQFPYNYSNYPNQNVTKTGFDFDGWIDSDTGELFKFKESPRVLKDKHFVAQWTPKPQTWVYFKVNGIDQAYVAGQARYDVPIAIDSYGGAYKDQVRLWLSSKVTGVEQCVITVNGQPHTAQTFYPLNSDPTANTMFKVVSTSPSTGEVITFNLYVYRAAKITFDPGPGQMLRPTEYAPSYVRYLSPIPEPKATHPEPNGYKLVGWFADGETEPFDFANSSANKDMTLKAQWEVVNPTIQDRFNVNGVEKIGEFTPDKTEYEFDVPSDTTTVSFDMVFKIFGYENAAVTVNGRTHATNNKYDLTDPVTEFKIHGVTSKNGGANTYTIKIVRDAPTTHEVTFDLNGIEVGPPPSLQFVVDGARATQPADPEGANGFGFAGWYTASDGGTKFDFENTPVTDSMTLYAQWKPLRTVTFDANGGTPTTTQVVLDGDIATEPTDPTRYGYEFKGWAIVDGGESYNFAQPVTGNLKLRAQWELNTYEVTFDTDGGLPEPAAQSIKHGEHATEPPEPTKDGYTFTGWYTASTGESLFGFVDTAITADITLYAQWQENVAPEPDDWGIVTFAFVDEYGNQIGEDGEIVEASPGDEYGLITVEMSYTVSLATLQKTRIEYKGVDVEGVTTAHFQGGDLAPVNNPNFTKIVFYTVPKEDGTVKKTYMLRINLMFP